MPIISMSNPKGGAGKSTTALLLATYLAERGARVCVLDADPNQPILDWKINGTTTSTLEVIGGVKESNLMETVERLDHQFVIIDLEGTASLLVSRAIALSDFVIVPLQASAVDVRQAGKAIRTIRDEEKVVQRYDPNRRIPYKVLLTRTPAPGAPVSGVQRQLEAELASVNIPRFRTTIADRLAYKAVFVERLTLTELKNKDIKVGNLEAAYQNIHDFATELVEELQPTPMEANRE